MPSTARSGHWQSSPPRTRAMSRPRPSPRRRQCAGRCRSFASCTPPGNGSTSRPSRPSCRMLILHPATLHLVSVIVTVVAAGVSLLTWYHHREGPGLRGWATALLLSGAGTVLFGLRGPDASFRVILFGDTLFVAGFAMMWMSMRRFNDRGVRVELMAMIVVAIIIVFAALFTLAWQVAPVMRAQSVVFSMFICV